MIIEKINEARTFFGIEEYPGNFFEHLIRTGSAMEEYGILLFKQDMGQTSGFIGYTMNDDPIICINYNRNIGHQNFTLAHEIGHLFLHKGITVCDKTSDIEIWNKQNKMENEAHEFASELIYPKELVMTDYKFIEKNNLFNADKSEKLADYVNELCEKYCISFSFALSKLLFISNWKYGIHKKMESVRKRIGKLSDRYDRHNHVVVHSHKYYQPYMQPFKELEEMVNELVNLEEIGYETGTSILNRNKGLGGHI